MLSRSSMPPGDCKEEIDEGHAQEVDTSDPISSTVMGVDDQRGRRPARGALRGVRVVEFGQYVPGPLAGALLADQGADVIKIERPGGDPGRAHPGFGMWNRGKRSVVLDLRSRAGQTEAAMVVRTADVVIENFRPGVAERLGIGYERLSRAHRSLIYCAMPGYGEEHPARDQQGWDPLVAARTGLYQPVDITTRTVSDGRAEVDPQFTPLHVPSTYAAMHAVTAIGAALFDVRSTGLGRRIEVPLHSAMHTAMGRVLIAFASFQPQETFTWPRRVMARAYRCSDGRWIQLHGMWPRFVRQTLTAAGHPEWSAEAEAFFGREVDDHTVTTWIDRFEQLFRTRSAEEWERAIGEAGGACTVMRTLDEWMATPHARAAEIVVDVPSRSGHATPQPGLQVQLGARPGRIRGAAPELGADTVTVLRSCRGRQTKHAPRSPATPSGSRELPLSGIRVLDLSVILAGPSCGRALAEYGADVIKIDDPTHLNDAAGYLDVNRGKRSIIVDLKAQEGRDVFWRLVDTSDVVLENYRRDSLDRLGLGYDTVRARRPNIVYASMNCHGYEGPWRDLPGWEQSAQAATGIQVLQGGSTDRPRLLHLPVSDYGTGLMGAYAIMLALCARARTGKGQRVTTGLSSTATLIQARQMSMTASERASEPAGPGARGWSPGSRMFATRDGWIYVHCSDDSQLHRLAEFVAPVHLADTDAMDDWFRAQSRAEVLSRLEAAAIPAAPVMSFGECRDDDAARSTGLVVTRHHPRRGVVTHLGTTVRLSPGEVRLGRPAPVPGLDTLEILGELGFSDAEIEQLIGRQAVAVATG
jgi:crotonobetainyl-CoA:carnitine CoA-transferase CaiB-like acyl-CoA transferase